MTKTGNDELTHRQLDQVIGGAAVPPASSSPYHVTPPQPHAQLQYIRFPHALDIFKLIRF